MDDLLIAVVAVLLAAAVAVAAAIGLARGAGGSGRRRRLVVAAAAGQALLLLATAAQLWLVRAERPPADPGSVAITAGAGNTGCVVDVLGEADVPAGRDLWLFLSGDDDVYFAQGGKPVREGPGEGAWSFLKARIANDFFQNAHYRWDALIVSSSTSDRLRESIGDGDDGWPLPAGAFPLDEQVSARAAAEVLLTEDVDCG